MSTPSHQSKARDPYRAKPSDGHGGPTPRHDPALRPTRMRELPRVDDGRCTGCGTRPSRETGKCRCQAQPDAPAAERLRVLMNSLGIVGPNIYHREWQPDDHMPEEWPGPGWCVCGRVMPCEAAEVGELLAAQPAPAPFEEWDRTVRHHSAEWPHGEFPQREDFGWCARCVLDYIKNATIQPAPAPSPGPDVGLLARAIEAAGIRWSVNEERQKAIAATIAAEYARLASEGEAESRRVARDSAWTPLRRDTQNAPACAAHVHGHAPCSLPTGHDGDHAAWVTDE